MARFQAVAITGASSGIGAALARACAASGAVLHLAGRDAARLEAVAEACRARGAAAHTAVLDVRDAAAVKQWIAAGAATGGRLDLVVANAGISAGSSENGLAAPERTRAILETNVMGVANTVLPALRAMAAQAPGADGWRGRIGVVASIAAFVPAPGAASYCASKAAADTFAVASARGARAAGVLISSICPGYVQTPMTDRNRFPMPGLMDADRAAAIILRGMASGRTRIAFPWWMAAAARLTGLLPPRLTGRLLAASQDATDL
ncbi:MAG: SDR family NAD(P)-dependent oxidoreductase [Proteobacteria bacterium]|nr:SDR family NAD(P)-dependent oxidoreductase [Pseudomonadota bacterium]